MATTGNPAVDAVVRERYVEAIGIVRQILIDNLEGVPHDKIDHLAAAIPLSIMPALSAIIIEGLQATHPSYPGEEDAEG